MKQVTRSALILTAILILTFGIAHISVGATSTDGDALTVKAEYYGRAALSELERADVLLYAYDKMVEGIGNAEESITIWDGTNTITDAEVKIAYDAYRRDHTEHFWLSTRYEISYNAVTALSIKPTYYFEGQALEAAKALFEEEAARLVEGIDSMMSDLEKELILHDRLAERVTYVESEYAHSAYGAIVGGEAVCEGYAEALQYLLGRVGVQSFLVLGSSINPTTNAEEGHAWNLVRIDGRYYHTDLTWNDQSTELYHAYFNMTEEQILGDHNIDPCDYRLPSADSTEAHYFNVYDGRIDGDVYSEDRIAELLLANNNKAHLYITGDMAAFRTWLDEGIYGIVDKMGVRALSYSVSLLERELVLRINTCAHSTLTPIAATAPECEKDGNTAYYVCECGSYFSDAEGKDEILVKSSVLIEAFGHDFTEAIEDEAHLKQEGDCLMPHSYWYSCSRCEMSAEDDPFAYQKFYTGTTLGDHKISTGWTSDGTNHYHECTVDGCDLRLDSSLHSGGKASCEELAVCDTCSLGYGELAEHSPDEGGSCAVCGSMIETASESEKADGKNVLDILIGAFGVSSTFFGNVLKYGAIALGGLLVLCLLPLIFRRRK